MTDQNTVSNYKILLVDSTNPENQVYFPSEELPVNIAAEQINVGLGIIRRPKNIEEDPVLLMKASYSDETFGTPDDSSLLYVSQKYKFLKNKDVRGDTTALTPFSFASYLLPISNTTIPVSFTLQTGASSVMLTNWTPTSQREFSENGSATFEYKSHLRRAVKVDVHVNITPSASFIIGGGGGPTSISLAVSKSNESYTGGLNTISVWDSNPLGVPIASVGVVITLSGTIIYEDVRRGDTFAFFISLSGGNGLPTPTPTAIPFTILSGSASFLAIPEGRD